MTELDTGTLKEDLKRLKKKPMGFAFGLKDAQTQVLLLHKTKSGRQLANDARSKHGAKTVTFGTARGEDTVLRLAVEGPALAGLEKKAKLFLRRQKLTLYTEIEATIVNVVGQEDTIDAVTEERTAAVAEAMVVLPLEEKKAQHAVSDAENEALSELSSDELRGVDLTQRNPKELFTDEYMTGLVGLKMPGANDPELKDVMRHLEKGVSGARRQEAIQALASILGKDAKKLDADYGRFLILRDQQVAVQKKKGSEYVPALIEGAAVISVHDEFMASNPQLVFGKVVGDAFGIDPVFGALLSPTGGMVGPGNLAVHLDDDDPTGYHGIVHDAAGYLKNYHDQGPGYDYREKEPHHSDEDALTGQQSGMRYWHEKLDPGVGTTVMLETLDVAYAVKDVYDGTKTKKELKIAVEKALTEVHDEMADAFDEAVDSAAKKIDEGVEELSAEMEQAKKDLSEAASEAAEAVEESVVENYDDARESLGEMADEVSDKLESAWSYVWE